MDDRFGDDLNQWVRDTIKIEDVHVWRLMKGFACILFDLDLLDRNGD